MSKKELRQKKSEIVAGRSKVINPIQKAISCIEDTIEDKETHTQNVNEQLLIASQDQDGPRIATLAKELASLGKEVESLFDELEKQMDEMEFKNKRFEKELIALERG